MPELPEVETTVRGLRPVLVGATLAAVEARRPDLRRPLPADLRQRLTGATVTAVRRRAKFGLIDTDRGDTMIFHLGMSGRWRIEPDALGPHDHLVLHTTAGVRLALNDARRFGSVDLMPTGDVAGWGPIAALGPEPYDDGLAAHLAKAFAERIAPVKVLLLDQRIVAGIGNIYACEALNVARIRPDKHAGRISRAAIARLADALPAVLDRAIAAGGSTLRDYARPDGQLGYFASEFRVYGREGEACPCGAKVERMMQAGRSTFWCRRCQR